PTELPEHVRLVVATLPGECLAALERKGLAARLLELEPMLPEEGRALLDFWLQDAGRALQAHQRQEVLRKFERNGLPLYLKLAFEEARLWRSYTAQPALSPDIPGIIGDLFARLSSEVNHGQLLVTRSLGYLAAAKSGLTEDELLDVLARDDEVFHHFQTHAHHELPETEPSQQPLPVVVWSWLYFDLEPYLAERSADGTTLLGFYHRQLRQTAADEYLPTKEARQGAHGRLADYF